MNIVFFDLETTGVYVTHDAPVQIAGICDKDGEIVSSFNRLARTNVTISPQASKVHGIYKKDLENEDSEPTVIKDFIRWLYEVKCDLLVGYNSKAFDLQMLNNRCNHFSIPSIFDGFSIPHKDGYLDCVKIVKAKDRYNLKTLLGRKWNLAAVSEILGIDNSGAHDALADVKMLRDIWNKLNRENQDLLK